MKKIEKKDGNYIIGKEPYFSFEPYAPLTPVQTFSRDLCALNCVERGLPLIDSLMQNTSLCSAAELKDLSENHTVMVTDGVCRMWRMANGTPQEEAEIKNLGTEDTPAFLYNNCIFALKPEKNLFLEVEPRMVFMTDDCALLLAADDLLITYKPETGLEMLGNFEGLGRTSSGYILSVRTGSEVVKSYEIIMLPTPKITGVWPPLFRV